MDAKVDMKRRGIGNVLKTQEAEEIHDKKKVRRSNGVKNTSVQNHQRILQEY